MLLGLKPIMIRYIKEITTLDTKQTYRWINNEPEGDIPQLIEIRLQHRFVDRNGIVRSTEFQIDTVYIERSTLEKSGLLSKVDDKGNRDRSYVVEETVEDLIVRLLTMLGVKFNE